jgi:hypothetical protein
MEPLSDLYSLRVLRVLRGYVLCFLCVLCASVVKFLFLPAASCLPCEIAVALFHWGLLPAGNGLWLIGKEL